MIINSIVLKTASKCNLNCSYCYIYNKGDLSYKSQPKYFSRILVPILLDRVLEYMLENDMGTFVIVFHGGEPMLNGIDFYVYFIDEYNRIFAKHPKRRVLFVMQTNGTLINKENAKVLFDLKINVGISMDTTKESNDNFRVYHNNKSSYNEILNGFKIMQEYDPGVGILSVIDVNYSAADTYKHIKSTETTFIDLLFPDETHDSIEENDIRGKLGEWLCELFDLWFEDKTKKPIIKVFTEVFHLILGTGNGYDTMGKNHGDAIVVESNGDIQSNDTFRVCKNRITDTKFNIVNDPLSVMHVDPLAKLYYNNHFDLCSVCSRCPIESLCGGGYVINRYSKINGFDNQSIYCNDLIKFITHVQNVIVDISDGALALDRMNYEEISSYVKNLSHEKEEFSHLVNYI